MSSSRSARASSSRESARDVHVSGLRKKLDDDPNEPRYIHTVRGVGFRFASPDEL
jgi:DNA-binding response OmpR family regulator